MSGFQPEGMRLSSGAGMWRSSAAWQAPGGSFITSTCALVLKGADEIYKSKAAFYKIYYITKHLVKNKLLLRNYGDSSNSPYPESPQFIFFLSCHHSTEEMKCFLAVVKFREAMCHLYILKRHLQVWKAIQNVPKSRMLRQYVCCGATFDMWYKLFPSLSLNFSVGTSWGYCLTAQHSFWMSFTPLWNILLKHSVSLSPTFTTIHYCCKNHKNDSLKANNSWEGK